MTTETQTPTRPRRRWLQFSLRTLLLLVVPIACVAAWVGAEYEKGRRQKRAIDLIGWAQGSVQYDMAASRDDWRRQWLGDWYPDRVVQVSMYRGNDVGGGYVVRSSDTERRLSDGAPLAALPHLRSLDLRDTTIDDLSFVAAFPELVELNLNGLPVEDLSPLAGLHKLKWLDISGTKVQDLSALTELRELEYLAAGATQVEDLAPLAELTQLRRLVMHETQVRDLAPIAQLPRLWLLNLDGTPVSDLAPLAGHPRLRMLVLCNTQVSDLAPLTQCEALRVLWAEGSRVSKPWPQQDFPHMQWRGLNATRAEGQNVEVVDVLLSLSPANEPIAPALEEVLGRSWIDFRQSRLHVFYPDYGIRVYWTSNWGRDTKFDSIYYGEPFSDQKDHMWQP